VTVLFISRGNENTSHDIRKYIEEVITRKQYVKMHFISGQKTFLIICALKFKKLFLSTWLLHLQQCHQNGQFSSVLLWQFCFC